MRLRVFSAADSGAANPAGVVGRVEPRRESPVPALIARNASAGAIMPRTAGTTGRAARWLRGSPAGSHPSSGTTAEVVRCARSGCARGRGASVRAASQVHGGRPGHRRHDRAEQQSAANGLGAPDGEVAQLGTREARPPRLLETAGNPCLVGDAPSPRRPDFPHTDEHSTRGPGHGHRTASGVVPAAQITCSAACEEGLSGERPSSAAVISVRGPHRPHALFCDERPFSADRFSRRGSISSGESQHFPPRKRRAGRSPRVREMCSAVLGTAPLRSRVPRPTTTLRATPRSRRSARSGRSRALTRPRPDHRSARRWRTYRQDHQPGWKSQLQ